MMIPDPKFSTIDDIYNLSFPLYITGIDSTYKKFRHIPGLEELSPFDSSFGWFISGYVDEDNRYLVDECFIVELYQKKICNIHWEKRWRNVKNVCNHEIANPTKVLDIGYVECTDINDLLDCIDNFKSYGHDKVLIKHSFGNYVFGQATKVELVEINI